MIQHWLAAFRLRTLPLALSSILMGGFLAYGQGDFSWMILGLSVLTTVFLQILSNLANDYGDSVHGADSVDRMGPQRAVQAGVITPVAMKRAMVVFAVLSLVSGLMLLYAAFADQLVFVLMFLGLGLLCIYAAITYTSGKNPYGYMGLGDVSVFLFFGLVGVLGSYFLYAHAFDAWMVLPAMSCGALATGVLNVNNIRDLISDEKAGKRSIPVRIGRVKAVGYHLGLLVLAMSCAFIFAWGAGQGWSSYLFVGVIPFLIVNYQAVRTKHDAADLDPYLKQLALSTLLFVVLFGLGQII
ncbi:1,4-dihydroxy-2-naphthoate octaprenyltransferase [Reichenbachiella sp. 5M10]|uniref:1,4-dihydroxy-2-naphthoate polyprenyltransferase n=1 Tax=Reichenbachiella sp. 5M10 TaxID=1889772 RepID=UPI000C14AF35|nr:1,4-dihydroxy-2-naphthoate polyprenyltransferase [Reichenbachiella sp. 5M10]PIB34171.1 1,4-dihydroxy-2-naphthoate octaprenyltransferase [Reichenbachiella sp. 5M10]